MKTKKTHALQIKSSQYLKEMLQKHREVGNTDPKTKAQLWQPVGLSVRWPNFGL